MNIPKSFKDVKVGEYIKLRPILDADYDNPLSKTIDLLSVFNDRDEVLKCKASELKEVDFLYTVPNGTLKQYFEINGKQYGIVNHVNDLEAGQYISVVTLLKDLADNPNLSYELIHDVLSCVIFPVDKDKKVLNIEPGYFRKLADDIYKHMSIEDAYPIALFFLTLSANLMRTTQDSLNQKQVEMMKMAEKLTLEVQKDLERDGVGS